MTREEEIRQAANADFEDIECCLSFIIGAEWADDNLPQDVINLNKVWHKASEMPNKDMILLFKDKFGYHIITWNDDCNWDWTTYVEDLGVQNWAYINDLLPKNK